MAKKGGLGKGFGINALIPEVIADEPIAKATDNVSINEVEPNRDQPRKQFDKEKLQALSESIKEHGIVQPIIVTKEEGYYKIVAGERRWRAAKMAGLTMVPVVVRDYSDLQVEQISLVENLQREDLNPMEEAAGYRQLMSNHGLTQEEVSQKIGRSRPAIANSLRLFALPEKIQNLLRNNQLSSGHARALLSLENEQIMYDIANDIINKGLSVREVERIVKKENEKKQKPKSKEINKNVANAIEETCSKLQDKYSTKVKINYSNKFKGKIEMSFSDFEQMNRLIDLLGCGE